MYGQLVLLDFIVDRCIWKMLIPYMYVLHDYISLFVKYVKSQCLRSLFSLLDRVSILFVKFNNLRFVLLYASA